MHENVLTCAFPGLRADLVTQQPPSYPHSFADSKRMPASKRIKKLVRWFGNCAIDPNPPTAWLTVDSESQVRPTQAHTRDRYLQCAKRPCVRCETRNRYEADLNWYDSELLVTVHNQITDFSPFYHQNVGGHRSLPCGSLTRIAVVVRVSNDSLQILMSILCSMAIPPNSLVKRDRRPSQVWRLRMNWLTVTRTGPAS